MLKLSSHRLMMMMTTLSVAAVAGVAACGPGHRDSPTVPGKLLDQQSVKVGGDAPSSVQLGKGDQTASVLFPAGVTPSPQNVDVALSSDVTKMGATPANGTVIQIITIINIVFVTPAVLQQALPPPPQGKTYMGATAAAGDTRWTIVGPARLVGPAPALGGTGATNLQLYEIDIQGTGIWTIVLVNDASPATGGSMGTGGTSGAGGAGGTGMGGSGIGGNAAMAAVAPFDGQLLVVPCGLNVSTDGARSCYFFDPPSVTMTCPVGGTQVMQSFTLGGVAGTTYEVTLQVRGIAELKNYTGGVRIAPTDPLASWYVGGMPNAVPTLFWNAYQMIVTDPAPFSIVQKFYFNAAPDPTFQRLEAFPINYQATIQVRAMSTVQLSISDSNCQSISNCGVGGPGIPNTQCLPITVPAVTDPRVPQPYVGQFILINVVSARGL